jgi:predicted dehydrogenase
VSATPAASRRDFLKTGAAAAAAAGVLQLAPAVHAGGNDTLKVGLIGCGGRGTGAASQALRADPQVKLIALGDAFSDRLEGSLNELLKDDAIKAKIDVPPDRRFVGFDAYKQVLASGVDVVLLTTPPHFRPLHLEAAIAAGKHVFAEKPLAVDAVGARRVLDACKAAQGKNLNVVSGFCWRRHAGPRGAFQRVLDGAVGDIVALQCAYNTGALWHKSLQEKAEKGWSDMEWQLRNWLYFTWLSGDHIVEQAIHSIDKMAWAMKDQHPIRATGLGGRQVRTAPDFGHIFDHHSVVYEFANGVKLFHTCRQQASCANDVTDHVFGTKGTCHTSGVDGTAKIIGEKPWEFGSKEARQQNMYQNEHNELFAAIRAGKPINDGEWMVNSTLLGIMGRMATYTGQVITWEQVLHSKEDLTPAKYEFGPLAVPPVARPGQTRLV